MVRHQKGKEWKEWKAWKAWKEWKGKRVRAGQSLPAWILGFCGILSIPVKQENEELLKLLQVPVVFAYVMAGIFEAVVQQSFNRRNDGIRKNTHYSQ